MTDKPANLDLDEIAARAAALYEYATVADPQGQDALNELTDTDVPALIAEVRRRTEPVALPARWECSHGPADDEPFCAGAEDGSHVCPTIRVHPDDAEAFAALIEEAHRRQAELRRERDLAHDRQPYPTAWAYEQACKAREKHRERADKAEALVAEMRAQTLRDAAEICDEAGAAYASKNLNDQAGAAFALMERFQRKANEAEYVATPCDSMNPCEDGGEPCHVHERLMAHADGEHELCGPDCAAP